jgi:hypothetical protein
MIEGKQMGGMNIDAKFQRIGFGIASARQWLPYLAMSLMLPN